MLPSDEIKTVKDAELWADEFIEKVGLCGTDRETIVAWFTGALTAGGLEGSLPEGQRLHILTTDKVKELAHKAAGAGTAPIMEDHHEFEMPAERVSESVNRLLHEEGFLPSGDQPEPSA